GSMNAQWMSPATQLFPLSTSTADAASRAAKGEPVGWLVYSPGPAKPSTYSMSCPRRFRPSIGSQAWRYARSISILAIVWGFAGHTVGCFFGGIPEPSSALSAWERGRRSSRASRPEFIEHIFDFYP